MESYAPLPLAFVTFDPEANSGDKAPIIFIHGVTASKEEWNDIPQIVANATKRKVYAIDSRNHGDSERSDVFNFECNVNDLLHFMDTMDIQKAVLIGHSMGGITSIKTALRTPERIEKVIVEDIMVSKPPPQIFDMVKQFIGVAKSALQEVPKGVDEATARKIIIDYIIKDVPSEIKDVTEPESLENLPMQLKRTEDGSYCYKTNLAIVEKALQNSSEIMTENVGVYEGPACFIYGSASAYAVPSDEANIKKHFPKAELIGIEKASHTVHTDRPQEFTEAVLSFLSRE